MSGYMYSCLYSNELVGARGREVIVRILRTSVAGQRIRTTMLLLEFSQTGDRREVNDYKSDANTELIKLL